MARMWPTFGDTHASRPVRCERYANHRNTGAFLRLYSERSAMSIHRPETAPPAVPAATTPQPKMRKPPPKVRAAIEALVTGQVKTITAAAKKVGLTRERLSRALSEPHIAEALRTRAAREVAMSAGRASARLTRLIDSGSDRVAFEATRFSLGVAGIKPAAEAQVNVNLEMRAGYVIDLRERSDRGALPVKVIEGAAGVVVDAEPAD
jgi:hypothetical protein